MSLPNSNRPPIVKGEALFRRDAVERLSATEDLDKPLRLGGRPGFALLVLAGGLLAASIYLAI